VGGDSQDFFDNIFMTGEVTWEVTQISFSHLKISTPYLTFQSVHLFPEWFSKEFSEHTLYFSCPSLFIAWQEVQES